MAATPLVGSLVDADRADAAIRASGSGSPVPMDAELVTVTDSSIVVTWFSGDPTNRDAFGRPTPLPADTTFAIGQSPSKLTTVIERDDHTAYHYAEVTGLEPGRTYYYEARSAGLVATSRVVPILPSPLPSFTSFDQFAAFLTMVVPTLPTALTSPGVIGTLNPPPGKFLFTVALTNDIHIGETTSGLIAGNQPPGFMQNPGEPPYPEVMAEAMVADTTARGADVLVVAGDLTAEARRPDVARSRQLLGAFGPLGTSGDLASGSMVACRGNHDRPHVGPDYAGCPVIPAVPDHHDCLVGSWPLPRQALTATEVGGLRIIGLDTTALDAPGGTIEASQFSELSAVLAADPQRPTLLFGHHPVTAESAASTLGGPTFDLNQTEARQLEALYAANPGVFFHHAGHTHRNKRTSSPAAPRVEFLEVCATKEYPGGFSLLHVYRGGYMVTFYKTRDDLAREWSQRTSGEYFGLYPSYTLGTLADRNHTVVTDLSGLRSPTARPGSELPEVGRSVLLPAVGVAAGGLALAGLARRNRLQATGAGANGGTEPSS